MEEQSEQLDQASFEEARRRLRSAVFISAVMDLFVAVVLFVLDIPIGALILVAFAVIGTPIVLAALDRGWRKRGYEIP